MKEYNASKWLGILVGMLTLLGALVFGVISLIGMGFSFLFHSFSGGPFFIIFVFLILSGIITIIGARNLPKKNRKNLYLIYCLIVGAMLLIGFFMSYGALGREVELLLLCLGIGYGLLAFVVIQGK